MGKEDAKVLSSEPNRVIGAHATSNVAPHTASSGNGVAPSVPEPTGDSSATPSTEEQLRTLVNSITETLYSLRVGRGTAVPVYYSPQLESLTGYTPAEALQTTDFWLSITHPDDRPNVHDGLRQVLSGRAAALEYRVMHRSGEERWVLDTPVPVRGDRGEITRINGSMLDITERKHLEERLRQAQKMETVGTLAGGIAHDFNTLLQIIGGNVEEAQLDVPRDHPATHSLLQAQLGVKRAASLVQQLLDFSRLSESKRESVSIDEIVAETVPLIQSTLGRNVRLEVASDPGVAEVYADRSHVQQVLINLCMNARDAMPEGGTISIRAQNVTVRDTDRARPANAPPGDYVRLQVRDNGTGMDAETRHRIFEPFFTTKPLGRGTGLGLAVAYTIVTEHRGWMDVHSAPGEGTLFSVYLPALQTGLREPGEEEHIDIPATILVVDRDPVARETLATMLESDGYFALTTAGSSEALAVIWTEGERIELVVCPADLPEMDPGSLATHLHAANRDAVLVCSAAPGDYGAAVPPDTPLLQKPYSASDVLPVVRDALRAARRAA